MKLDLFLPVVVAAATVVLVEQVRAAGADEWISWNPGEDQFAESAIDMRSLNEKFAGENGYIQAKDGHFVHEKTGKPVRFWGVNTGGPFYKQDDEQMKKTARFLAKYGVNLARLHHGICDMKTGEADPAAAEVERKLIHSLKQEGIYSILSIIFPMWLTPQNGPGWREHYNGSKKFWFVIKFDEEIQEVYRNWWRELLLKPGLDGVKLVDDPAVLGLEIINEDTFFFWNFRPDAMPEFYALKIEKIFGDWATKKYGSLEKALAAWKNVGTPRDNIAEGRLGFRNHWNIFMEKKLRDQDTVAFWVEQQRGFYDDTVKFLRELGYKGMVSGSNMHAADPVVLTPLEKYTNLAGHYMDRHGYFESNHNGDNSGWSIRNGHTYSNISALNFRKDDPKGKGGLNFSNPIHDTKYNNIPSINSEVAWCRPSRYRSEEPIFSSAYGSLQDSDGFCHFAMEGLGWNVKPNFFMQQWTLVSPSQFGQFPAAAFMYRQGLIKPGDLMADIRTTLADLIALKGVNLGAAAALDAFRAADVPKEQLGKPASEATIDPRIFLIGRTAVQIDDKSDKAGKTEVKSLSPFIDAAKGIVKASNGQMLLDYSKGLLTINAPQAQGVSGNLAAAGKVALSDIAISSINDNIHILAISLDGTPLAASQKILVQVMTEDRPSNFVTEPTGTANEYRIKDIGRDPWQFAAVQGKVVFNRRDASSLKVTPLDHAGYPAGNSVKLSDWTLAPDKTYYLISK